MLGLLTKDFYVIFKQMKWVFILSLLGAFALGGYIGSMLIISGALLPITTMAYDEQSKWEELATVLPYSTKDRVLSKYICGYIFTALATLIVYFVTPLSPIRIHPDAVISLTKSCFLIGLALIILSISLPITFRFGVEQSRFHLTMIALIFFICFSLSIKITIERELPFEPIAMITCIMAIILNILSLRLSIRFLERKL